MITKKKIQISGKRYYVKMEPVPFKVIRSHCMPADSKELATVLTSTKSKSTDLVYSESIIKEIEKKCPRIFGVLISNNLLEEVENV